MRSADSRRRWRRLGTGAAALVMFVPALLVTAGTAQASAGPNVVQARTTAKTTLPDAGATLITVESVQLAKGSWTVTSNATAVNFGSGDFVRCQLAANGHVIDGGATTYLSNEVGGLVDVGTWKSRAESTVALRCDHDHFASSSGQFYFDPGVTMTAVRGGPIKSPTVHTKATPTVVEARTASAVSLSDTDYTLVTSVKLPEGTWATTANASAVDFDGQDFAYCTLTVDNGGTITSSSPLVGVYPPADDVAGITTEATVIIPASGDTVMLECATDFGTDLYLDAGATLTATLVPHAERLVTRPVSGVDLPAAGATAIDVVSKNMPAGAWRVQTAVVAGLRASNNGYAPGTDFVRCSLWADTTPIDGGATILARAGYIEALVNAGTFTATSSWTLRLSCSHDAATPDTYTWTIIDGMAQAIRQGPIASMP